MRIATTKRERGAVAITVGLSLVVLIGMAGLVFDLGQMFVSKTELQNAADACALAAARELNTTPTTLAVLTRAENAGITTGKRNKVGFQDADVTFATDRDVTFSASFVGGYVTKAGAPLDTRYARCSNQRTGIAMWFMQVLGMGDQQVASTAVASLQGSSGEGGCGVLPLGFCKHTLPVTCSNPAVTPTANGLCKGQWYDGRFSSGGGATGNFNWLDFTPHGGGAGEVRDALQGPGACDVALGDVVHAEPGVNQSVEVAWNSRFGLYKNGSGQPSKTTAPPDWTGYAYSATNWALQRDALADFLVKRDLARPYDGSDGTKGIKPYAATTSADHLSYGVDRRLVFMPIVDCAGWGPTHTTTISGMACAFMLSPNGMPNENIFVEFVAERGQPGDLCGTQGPPGGPGGAGPAVPTLVQ